MIYALNLFSAVLLILLSSGLTYLPPALRRSRPVFTISDASTAAPTITVRFINTPSGKDVVAQAEPGANLMLVGDAAGVKLPRACRTGLCGSCTCELQDPLAIKTATNPRDGFATIRACSVKCFVPEGMSEMVVDVYRMSGKGRMPVVPNEDKQEEDSASTTNPMARFSGNWEKEFRPNWEVSTGFSGQVGGASDPLAGAKLVIDASSNVFCTPLTEIIVQYVQGDKTSAVL